MEYTFEYFDTIEKLDEIPAPLRHGNKHVIASKENICSLGNDKIAALLVKIATKNKRKNIDLSIESLRKAIEYFKLFPAVYDKSYYMRLPNYLRIAGRNEEAVIVEQNINDYFKKKWEEYKKKHKDEYDESGREYSIFWKDIVKKLKKEKCDLVVTKMNDRNSCCCSECAKYRNRIFSISGEDSRFPVMPEYVKFACCFSVSLLYEEEMTEEYCEESIRNILELFYGCSQEIIDKIVEALFDGTYDYSDYQDYLDGPPSKHINTMGIEIDSSDYADVVLYSLSPLHNIKEFPIPLDELISYSNRPYIDERTNIEIENYCKFH